MGCVNGDHTWILFKAGFEFTILTETIIQKLNYLANGKLCLKLCRTSRECGWMLFGNHKLALSRCDNLKSESNDTRVPLVLRRIHYFILWYYKRKHGSFNTHEWNKALEVLQKTWFEKMKRTVKNLLDVTCNNRLFWNRQKNQLKKRLGFEWLFLKAWSLKHVE